MSILTQKRGAAYWITLNNPSNNNIITKKMQDQLCDSLDEANCDDDILITVITGEGEYYSSGINPFPSSDSQVINASVIDQDDGYLKFINKIFEHRKILMALVNGPALGIAATTLCLMDYVVCSDAAYFDTPLPYIGVGPEGVSSVMFERANDAPKVSETLLFGKSLSATEALKRGIVAHVFPHDEFREKAAELVSVLASNELMRREYRREMIHTLEDESRLIKKQFFDEKSIGMIRSKLFRAKL